MSASWVAGSTRARLLAGRRVGREGAVMLARAASLPEACSLLAGGRFGSAVAAGDSLERAQRGIAAQALLELRLLAGWLPDGGELVRVLAGWFEIRNIEDRLAYLSGGPLQTALTMGSLATAWPRAAVAETPDELRAALRASAWGDPGGESAPMMHLGLRLAWMRRVARVAPEARGWAAAALAMLLARVRFLTAGAWDEVPVGSVPELGGAWRAAQTLAEFTAALPARAAGPLAGLDRPHDLWRAEPRWWLGVEDHAEQLVRRSRAGRAVVVGAVGLLAADAVRVAAALAVPAVGGAAGEVFDVLV